MKKPSGKWFFSSIIPNYFTPLLRILFGLTFIFSGIAKIINVADFQYTIEKFALIPDLFAPTLSYLIPIIETVIGFFLIFNFYPLIIVQFSIYLILFFTSVIIVKVLEGGDLSCGCFGSLSTNKIDEWTIMRNVVFLIWGVILIYLILQSKSNLILAEKFKRNLKMFLINTLLFFLLVQNAAFAIRNIELKNRVYRLLEKDFFSRGEQVEPFIAYKIDGSFENVFYDLREKTILFIMKYGCITCKNNVPFWNDLNEEFNSNRIRVIGISVDKIDTTKKMIGEYKINFNVAYNTTEEFNRNFRIFMTPMTIIINSDGIVEEIWKGAIKQNSIALIKQNLLRKHKERR